MAVMRQVVHDRKHGAACALVQRENVVANADGADRALCAVAHGHACCRRETIAVINDRVRRVILAELSDLAAHAETRAALCASALVATDHAILLAQHCMFESVK